MCKNVLAHGFHFVSACCWYCFVMDGCLFLFSCQIMWTLDRPTHWHLCIIEPRIFLLVKIFCMLNWIFGQLDRNHNGSKAQQIRRWMFMRWEAVCTSTNGNKTQIWQSSWHIFTAVERQFCSYGITVSLIGNCAELLQTNVCAAPRCEFSLIQRCLKTRFFFFLLQNLLQAQNWLDHPCR